MPTSVRALAVATHAFDRQARALGEEFRECRLTLNVSQEHVAAATRIYRNRYGRIEGGRCPNVTLAELNRIGSVLGLTIAVRTYPAGPPVRDAGHATRLATFLGAAAPPLAYRIEVPLPIVEGRAERRAWDAVLFGNPGRCGVELEMRLRDVQALMRRIDLKRRDDAMESFLLLVADTRDNRQILAEFDGLFRDLPRLPRRSVRNAFAEGRLPPTGILRV